MSELHRGGCLCGAVRYRAEGAPLHTNICHCTQCRRQTGSALPSFATFTAAAVTLEQGAPATFRSSERAVRQFCNLCGAVLFWREDGADQIDIFLGSFDAPQDLPRPQRQIWARHRLPWLDDVPAIPAWPEGGPP